MAFVDNHNLICIDWNGVLDTYTGYANGKVYPIRPGAKEFLFELRKQGYRLAIMTAAPKHIVEQWIVDNGIGDMIEQVTNVKLPAILYIDDRAICFRGNFDETLKQIETFRVFWSGETHT